MDDMSLSDLQTFKAKLQREYFVLDDDLKKRRASASANYAKRIKVKRNTSINKVILLGAKCEKRQEKKLCEVSSRTIGVSFDNVDKKWLHNDVYLYVANVLTETISFYLQLKVEKKSKEHSEVLDIVCTFVQPTKSLMKEVSPWVEMLTKMKNFASFITAVSDYNEQSVLRSKIVQTLQDPHYATVKDCTDERGGLLLYIHSPKNTKQDLLEFQWSLMFVERKWRIEHFFRIIPTESGLDFVDKNADLMDNFCKLGLTRKDLIHLWCALCNALDDYKVPKAYKKSGNPVQNPNDSLE